MTSRLQRRAPRRGTTLVEVLIVVAIISLVAGTVGFAAYDEWQEAQIKTTTVNATNLRHQAEKWRIEHGPDCPDVEALLASGTLDKSSSRRDAWGQDWQIECVDNETSVTSAGPDRQLGTPDDIKAPPT